VGFLFANRCWYPKTRVGCSFIRYQDIGTRFCLFVTMHACDRQTDRITTPKNVLASLCTFMVTSSDAIVSACRSASHFKCANSLCLPKIVICDGYDHCGDESDEAELCCEFYLFIVCGNTIDCKYTRLIHKRRPIGLYVRLVLQILN